MANTPFAFLHKSPIDFFYQNYSLTVPVAVHARLSPIDKLRFLLCRDRNHYQTLVGNSFSEVMEIDGMNLKEMNLILLKKVEEMNMIFPCTNNQTNV